MKSEDADVTVDLVQQVIALVFADIAILISVNVKIFNAQGSFKDVIVTPRQDRDAILNNVLVIMRPFYAEQRHVKIAIQKNLIVVDLWHYPLS